MCIACKRITVTRIIGFDAMCRMCSQHSRQTLAMYTTSLKLQSTSIMGAADTYRRANPCLITKMHRNKTYTLPCLVSEAD
jgi:hypothetical protein